MAAEPVSAAAVLTPAEMERRARAVARADGLSVKVLGPAQLEREIAYAKQRVADAQGLLSAKLAGYKNESRAIDAGKSAAARARPKPIQRKFARVGTKEELASMADGTMITVNGRGISDSYFNAVMDYLRENAAGGDENLRAQRALYDLIRIEAVASQFEENEGEVRLGQHLNDMTGGKSIMEIAKTEGSVQTADENGRVEVTRNSVLGRRRRTSLSSCRRYLMPGSFSDE